MTVKRLLESLDGISAIIEAAGARKAAEGIRTLKNLFPGDIDRPAIEAVRELGDIVDSGKLADRAAYVERLLRAGTDGAKFDEVCRDIDADRRMNKEDVSAIAHSFTGGRTKWRSRSAAVEAMRKKFNERAYQESKMRIVERYKIG